MTGTDRVYALIGVTALILGAVAVAIGGFTFELIGFVAMAVGVVVLIGLAFLIVGESEDRDRRRHPRG